MSECGVFVCVVSRITAPQIPHPKPRTLRGCSMLLAGGMKTAEVPTPDPKFGMLCWWTHTITRALAMKGGGEEVAGPAVSRTRLALEGLRAEESRCLRELEETQLSPAGASRRHTALRTP